MPVIYKYLRFYLLGAPLLCLIASFDAFSVEPSDLSSNIQYQIPRVKTYNVEDGLSQISVYDIEQDKNGYVWLATQAGIDRFDGYTFTHYGQSKERSKGLSGSQAYSIEIDPVSGDIWIATINGLNVLRFATQSFERFELYDHQGSVDKSVRTVFIDAEQNIFVGSKQALYMKSSGARDFTIISKPNQAHAVKEIITLNNNRMLVATSKGVMSYDKKSAVWRDEMLSEMEVTAIELDNAGYLWIGTIGEGVFRAQVNGNNFSNIENISTKEGFATTLVNDIHQMNDGSIWVATLSGAFIFPNPNSLEFITFSNQSDISDDRFSNNIYTLLSTDSGLIFFGTDTSGFGVLDINATMFKRLTMQNKEQSFFITMQDDDTLWVATNNGVLKVLPDFSIEGPWQSQENQQSINRISTIDYSEAFNTLWLGSRLGLSKLVDGSDFIEEVALQNIAIYSLKSGFNQNLWVGTRDHGLYLFDQKNNQVVSNYDLPMVTKILPVSPEQLMVATTGGIYLINPRTQEIRRFVNDPGNENSLIHDVVTWISQRDQTSFYIGTQGYGVMLLELDTFDGDATFTKLFADADLPAFSVGAMVEDNNGNVWISTEKNIYRGNVATGEVNTFVSNDGVNSTGYYVGAQAIKSDGTIFFAGYEGVSFFHPDNMAKSQSMPELVFTRVAILNSDDSQGIESKYGAITNDTNAVTRISLSPDHVLVNIEFSALEFGSPESIEYAYRLIGFDDRWQYLDSKNRTVTYTNLDPGGYVLEVKSTNRYGVWSDKPQRMPILVAPPWWRTPWAIMMFGLSFIIATFVIFRWRTYALHKRSVMLYQSVQEKTAELQKANEQLTFLTTLDPLTQLFNRRGFTDAVGKEFSKYKRNNELFSIILIDIDFFKRINDEYGHEAGDTVLVEFAAKLQQSTRDYDILARWGGEEFIVLLPNTQLKDAINIANKYREKVRESEFEIGDKKIQVSLTAGVANIQDSATIDECIKRADSFLYEGKNLGRDQVLPML